MGVHFLRGHVEQFVERGNAHGHSAAIDRNRAEPCEGRDRCPSPRAHPRNRDAERGQRAGDTESLSPGRRWQGQFRPWPEVTFTVQITNTGHKDIRAVRGTITFATLFGDPIDKTRWTLDAGVKAGQHASEQVTMTLYYEGGDKLANPLSNLKVLWEPDGIIFSDGTTLGNVSQE
jgi:hypothetical protein